MAARRSTAADTSAGRDGGAVPDGVARSLLDAGPDGYTAARDAEVKRLRAAGDRVAANAVKALGRPNLVLWAVLQAGADAASVQAAVEATTTLAEVQASPGERDRLAAASAARRQALDAVTDLALAALGGVDRAGASATLAGRRDEVRSLVDRLTRHPDLLPAWREGTLRELPEDDLGFGAFAAVEPAVRAGTERAAAGVTEHPVARATGPAVDAAGPPPPDRREVDAARRRLLEAERALQAAETAWSSASEAAAHAAARAEAAREALAGAEAEEAASATAATEADRRRSAAEQEHDEAARRLAHLLEGSPGSA